MSRKRASFSDVSSSEIGSSNARLLDCTIELVNGVKGLFTKARDGLVSPMSPKRVSFSENLMSVIPTGSTNGCDAGRNRNQYDYTAFGVTSRTRSSDKTNWRMDDGVNPSMTQEGSHLVKPDGSTSRTLEGLISELNLKRVSFAENLVSVLPSGRTQENEGLLLKGKESWCSVEPGTTRNLRSSDLISSKRTMGSCIAGVPRNSAGRDRGKRRKVSTEKKLAPTGIAFRTRSSCNIQGVEGNFFYSV